MSRFIEKIQKLGYDPAAAVLDLGTVVEQHLKRSREPPSRFGRRAVNNPRFVFQLREGRQCRLQTIYRALKAIKEFQPKLAA